MKEYHFIFFFSSKKSRPKRVEKRLKEALLGIFGNFIAQDRSSIEIYLFSTLIGNSSFLFSFPYSIFPPVETRSFAALYLWWKTGLEPCFHERCVHTVQFYIYIYTHPQHEARARTRSGGWRATRHEKWTDLDPARWAHTSGSSWTSQRVKRLLSLSNGDLRCSFRSVQRDVGGGRSFPRHSSHGEEEIISIHGLAKHTFLGSKLSNDVPSFSLARHRFTSLQDPRFVLLFSFFSSSKETFSGAFNPPPKQV